MRCVWWILALSVSLAFWCAVIESVLMLAEWEGVR